MKGAVTDPVVKLKSEPASMPVVGVSAEEGQYAWLGIGVLVTFAVLYSLSALLAPFWNDNDTWSNLLPVIHFRQSLLEEHRLPLFTDLWYGGRAQWANPLWNFLYLPSTLVWLILPLDWGTRLVFLGHLVFSLLAARKLASLFLSAEIERAPAALILVSPALAAWTAGHVEKVLSWGWVLLAIFLIMNRRLPSRWRGLGGGLCLGIVPLAGANYYSLYAAILLLPLALSFRDRRLLGSFLLGAMVGFLHLPGVWHMIGDSRAHARYFIELYSVSLLDGISALATGLTTLSSWESWTPIGIPVMLLSGFILFRKIRHMLWGTACRLSRQDLALLAAISILVLLATGIAYRGHGLLDSFRVPARALTFVALGIALFVLTNVEDLVAVGWKRNSVQLVLLVSAVQIALSAWMVLRPEGSSHSPYEASVQRLAAILQADNAKSVWFSTPDLEDMYIHAGLTRNNLGLPAVYYGDMGQSIDVQGDYCGYSFDHLLAFAPVEGASYPLYANVEWSDARGEIPVATLQLLQQVEVGEDNLSVYRVVCDP